MCGITGFNWKDEKLIDFMNEAIKHRGPDGEGSYVDKNVSLGHRRLAILDLTDKGKQPMSYKSFVITYNGEIYNFQEIRKKLENKGHNFLSNSDTELILHAYEVWGKDCVKEFNGMWAFCIYDKKKNVLFLSRDRFGVKPLYYYFDGKRFIFASEIKAIKKHKIDFEISTSSLNCFFYQKYIGRDSTIFNKCFKLQAGRNLIFDLKNAKIKVGSYYNLSEEIEKEKEVSIEDRIKKIEVILKDATEKRLISDVPVGSFLSGGVDSSLISAIIAKNHKNFETFSIGFEEKSFDEVPFSKKVSGYIKTKHNIKYVEMDEEVIKYIISNMDEPFGDSSIIPTYLLSKVTKEKITVALSGDAGDEVFGGYDSYKGYYISKYIPDFIVGFLKLISKFIPADGKKLSLSFKIKRFVRDYDKDAIKRHNNWMATFNNESRKKLLLKNFIRNVAELDYSKDLIGIQKNDIENYMCEDILKKVDSASMLCSLEVRSPFLDYRLVPLVLSLPEKYKIRLFQTKWLLKKISEKYLPREIIYRKKRGFSVPLAKWIKENNLIKDYLTNKKYYSHNYLNRDFVQDLYKEHMRGKGDNSRELWLVFVFNYWWNNNEKKVF